MSKEQLAALLNGREYGNEITDDEAKAAKAAGLAVVFGYSDDNAELRGAINDEIGRYGGNEFVVNRRGVVMMPTEDETEVLERFNVLKQAIGGGEKIKAKWGCEGYSWTYETAIPHATFDIMEDGEKFCRGIVFSINDLPQ